MSSCDRNDVHDVHDIRDVHDVPYIDGSKISESKKLDFRVVDFRISDLRFQDFRVFFAQFDISKFQKCSKSAENYQKVIFSTN